VAAVMLTALVNLLAAPGIEPVVQLVDLRCWLALICWASAMTSGARRYAQHHAAHGHRLRRRRIICQANMTSASLNWSAALANAPGGVAPSSLGMPAASLPARAADQGDSQVTTAAIGVVRISLRSMDNVRSTR
jgi:hypothetical protein